MAQKYRFRNVFGKSHTKWEDIQPLGGATDGFIVAGNSKFIAFPLQGGMGSTLGVLSYQQAGRVKNITQIRAHTSHITDFKFLPYQENNVVTASQDATVKIWQLDDENNKDIDNPLTTLSGHGLKVNLIAPHHSAKGIIATSSYDKTIKVWDTEEERDILTINQGAQYALSLEWSHDGSLLGSTWNDKQVRIIDPRNQTFVKEFGAHQSTRAQKFAWLGNTNHFITTGFDQLQKRQLFLWDIRNTSKHINVEGCSQAQGVLHPFYDNDLGILYLNGKGEGLIRFFEYQNGQLTNHLNDIMVTDTTKGYGFLPKYCVDTNQNEICRVIKLCGKYAEAVSIVYPRKTNDFQEDLYPDCAIDFGQTAQQWLDGTDIPPKVTPMKNLQLGQNASHVTISKPSTTHAQNIAQQASQNPQQHSGKPERKQSHTQTESNSNNNNNNNSHDNHSHNHQQHHGHHENKEIHHSHADTVSHSNNNNNSNNAADESQKQLQTAEIETLKNENQELMTQLENLQKEIQVQSYYKEESTKQISALTEEVETLKQELASHSASQQQAEEQSAQQAQSLIQLASNRSLVVQALKEAISAEQADHDQILAAAKSLIEFEGAQ